MLGNTNVTELKTPTKKFSFKRGVSSELEERNITQETAEKFGVEKLYHEGSYYGYQFPLYDENGEMVAQKVKQTVDKRMKVIGEIAKAQMFGMKAFPNAGKFITIVEGEEDALAAYQMLKKHNKGSIDPPGS